MAPPKQDDRADVLATGEELKDGLSCCATPGQTTASITRTLTDEKMDELANDQTLVSDFKQMKLEKEAQKNWDLFYKRNATNFFKDRHWTTREFEELKLCREVKERGIGL